MTIFIQFLTSQSQLDKANGDYVVMIDGARVTGSFPEKGYAAGAV